MQTIFWRILIPHIFFPEVGCYTILKWNQDQCTVHLLRLLNGISIGFCQSLFLYRYWYMPYDYWYCDSYTLYTFYPLNVSACMFVKFWLFYHSWDHPCQWYADPHIPFVSLLFKKWEGWGGGGGSTYLTGALVWYYDWGRGLLFRGGQLLECGHLFKEIYTVFAFLWTIHCIYLLAQVCLQLISSSFD